MSFLNRLFGHKDDAATLYGAIVERARAQHWYTQGGVADTIDGRFDMIAAILSLTLLRIESDPTGDTLGVALAERFVDDMDPQLREIGIGDIVVGKHIGRMMSMLGGRLGAYRDGLAMGSLAPALLTNLYRDRDPGEAAMTHVENTLLRLNASLAATPLDTLAAGRCRSDDPEFSRPRRLDTLGEGAATARVEADAAERAALAKRFGLIALDRLAADYTLRRDASGIVATGMLSAAVSQPCIATGDPVPATIDEPFDIRFLPDPGEDAAGEHELDPGDLDTMFYSGAAIDLGEAAAETLGLALDPYPRSPEAEGALRAAGVKTEDDARPTGALAGLKDLLDRK